MRSEFVGFHFFYCYVVFSLFLSSVSPNSHIYLSIHPSACVSLVFRQLCLRRQTESLTSKRLSPPPKKPSRPTPGALCVALSFLLCCVSLSLLHRCVCPSLFLSSSAVCVALSLSFLLCCVCRSFFPPPLCVSLSFFPPPPILAYVLSLVLSPFALLGRFFICLSVTLHRGGGETVLSLNLTLARIPFPRKSALCRTKRKRCGRITNGSAPLRKRIGNSEKRSSPPRCRLQRYIRRRSCC